MKLPGLRSVQTVADLQGGAYARLDLGLVRVTHARFGLPDLWVRLLRDDFSETGQAVLVTPETRVLEVIERAKPMAVQGSEVDPLMGGVR